MEEQNLQPSNEENVEMSEVSTLTNIFFEPGRTFLSFVTKPRFLMAATLSIIAMVTYSLFFNQKIGEERMARFIAQQIEKNPQVESMSKEDKQKIVDQQVKFASFGKYIAPIFLIIYFLLGGLIYWLAGNAMGGNGTFLKGLSVLVYSSFPIWLVWAICNLIVLFLKSPDEIDIGMSQGGVLSTNLSFLIDGKAMPVLATILGTFDVFKIWGWILAAIGLRLVCKLSSTSAWAIVLILGLVALAVKVLLALVGGNPVFM
jgi:hypothetical protein